MEVSKAAGVQDMIDARPQLAAWAKRCLARPSWQYAISGKVVDDYKGATDPLGRATPWAP